MQEKYFKSVSKVPTKQIIVELLLWRHGVVVITAAQLHSIKAELRLCAGSNPARGVSEIRHDENLSQWSRLKVKLNAFSQSTVPQNNSSSSSL